MAVTNLTNEDLYTSETNPTNTVNPKKKGALWTNNTTGRVYTCTNNTLNANVWTVLNPYLWRDLGNVTGTYNFNFGGANNDYDNFTMALTGTTNFGTVTSAGSRERSGLLLIRSGGTRLNRFFTNAVFSFSVPILSYPNNSGNGNILVFPYYIMPTGFVIFTRI